MIMSLHFGRSLDQLIQLMKNNNLLHQALSTPLLSAQLNSSYAPRQLFSEVISLKLLEYLEVEMQPHYQHFSLIQVALIIDKYIALHLLKKDTPVQAQRAVLSTEAAPHLSTEAAPHQSRLVRNLSERGGSGWQVREEQAFEVLLQQLKAIFLYYSSQALSYEMVNEYVYNQQLQRLSSGELDEDYIQIGEKRARLDQNLKLCIMPLSQEGIELNTSKIRQLVFRENKRGTELDSVFTVTAEYVRCIRIRPELIGIAADFNRKGEGDCWYRYEPQLIRPKRATLSVLGQREEGTALSSAELKEIRATNATNMEDMFSQQNLNLLKASVSQNLLGMISLDQSFLVQPLGSPKNKLMQGYIGNLLRDVPVAIAVGGVKEKYQQILLFENYSDTEWLILTDKFLYFYRIPLPAENIILKEQNNLHRAALNRPNPLLLMCQRLPQGCLKAITLKRPFLALMLQSNCVVIVKLIVNSVGIFQGRELRMETNYFKITNKIYNDIQFKTMCFNETFNNMFLADFGAYLIRMAFNPSYGDIQEEGITHDRRQSLKITYQASRNSFSELKASRSMNRRGVIQEVPEGQQGQDEQQFIQVHYLKGKPRDDNHLFSIYKKQNSSPHTVVIKNQTRQVITFLATNPNFNTLITYQAESYEKKTGTEWQGDKYRQWGNRNKLKLWDIRHMTIFKTYDVALELSCLHLRSNGLFALTADRGYLVYYPLNEQRRAILGAGEQKMAQEVWQQLQEVALYGNSLYFSTITSSFNRFSSLKVHRTHIYQLKLQKYPQIKLLQQLPSEITALAASSRLYVLENATQGVEASQLHIYNRLGLKQEMVVFSNPELVNTEGKINQENYSQEYKFLKRIDHPQFEVVVWNSDSLKMLGTSAQQSYTIFVSSSRINHVAQGIERVRAIRDIAVIGNTMLLYCEITTRIREKGALTETASKASESAERRSNPKERMSRVHEHSEHSIILISNQIDRITYRLQRISPKVKVLHIYNQLVLTREEVGDFDCVRVLDVGERGQIEKLLFAGRFRRNTVERVRAGDFKDAGFYELSEQKNILLQEIREYSVRKLITLEDTRLAISKSNKLVVLLVFKVETHYSGLVTKRQFRSQVEFMVYARNISDELLNTNYKISKIQVGKKTEKHLYEYQTSAARAQSIFGNKVLSLDDCFAISNYTEINMQQFADLIELDPRAQGVDITGKILSPKNINNTHALDIYEVLSLKRDKLLYERFMKESNQVAAVNAFSFKIVEFNDDDLTGTIVITNKLMRTLSIYTFEIDCAKRQPFYGAQEQEIKSYELHLSLQKIAFLEVKDQREINAQEQKRRSQPAEGKEEVQHVKLLEWSEGYKSAVDEMWQNTMVSIKKFIRTQHEGQTKRSTSLPPVALHKLNTLQIKKKEMLKKKLSASQRYVPPPLPKPLESDGASLMFKKWTISQGIQLEKEGKDANTMAELKTVNRYINKVLRSEEDTSQRVQQLIKNTRKMKEISQRTDSRNSSPIGNQQSNKSMIVAQLENVLLSSEAAKESSISTYLQQKQRTHTEQTKQNSYKLSRNDTNHSEITDKISSFPNQTRANPSKLSNHTNFSRKSKSNSGEPSGLQVKIKLKLQQLQEGSLSKGGDGKFYTPQRIKTNPDSSFNMALIKTDQSRYNNTGSPEERYRIIRLTTEPNESLTHKLHSQVSFTLTPSQDLAYSPSPNKNRQEKKFQEYKNNFSLIGYKQREGQARNQGKSREQKAPKESAVQRLKRSEQVMKSVYLPQIASTKEKLMKKMKQRSYVKTIQAHLNDSTLLSIRDGEKRKQLIRKLYEQQ